MLLEEPQLEEKHLDKVEFHWAPAECRTPSQGAGSESPLEQRKGEFFSSPLFATQPTSLAAPGGSFLGSGPI